MARTVRTAAVAGCLTLLAGAATAAAAPPPSGADPLVVAVEAPISGPQASNGRDQVRGALLAARHQNARGGVLGRRVVIHRVDDRGEAARARAAARGVIARGVRFVIGPYNSSVGLVNLPIYRRAGVLPLWMTSSDATRGAGATLQPMNSQIAPVEARHVLRLGAGRVAMLVDQTANGAFTRGMADRLSARLRAEGVEVVRIPVEETGSVAPGYYADRVAEALATNPDLVYVSTYFPEGVEIAAALTAAGGATPCLMGLANVDNGLLAGTTLDQARRCAYAGVVAAGQMPSARAYVRQYRRAFGVRPGVWGSFYYDSARALFAAIERAGTDRTAAVGRALRATRGLRGATGPITIDRRTGYRVNVPVDILTVNARKRFVIAPAAP